MSTWWGSMPWRFIYMYSWRPYLLGGWRWFSGSGELSHPNFASCSLDPRHPHQYEHSHLHHHHNNVHRHRIWSLLSSLLDWLSIQLSPRWPRLFHQSCNDHYSLLSLWFLFLNLRFVNINPPEVFSTRFSCRQKWQRWRSPFVGLTLLSKLKQRL